MTTELRTRTPKPHPYLITITTRDDMPIEVLVEAHSVTQAQAWFVQNFITTRKAEPREVHAAGVTGTAFYSAIEPDFGPLADTGEPFVSAPAPQQVSFEGEIPQEPFPGGSTPE